MGKNSDPNVTILPSVLEEVTGYFTCAIHYHTTHHGTTSVLLHPVEVCLRLIEQALQYPYKDALLYVIET